VSEPGDLDAELAAGTIVGEFCVERLIGRGSFGRVYRATHPVIHKLVAIKVLAHKYSTEPEMVNRFVTEARAVNQIRHRNIIDIFSFGTLPDGRAYYVMELLEGRTLHARLKADGRIALADALPILRDVARALDAAHAKGIAHRDLKPDNVFLVDDGEGALAKLLDFGIAKLLLSETSPHKTVTGIAVGTAFYMSPEQCRGKGVDHRTDIYAFGVVAYQMLTGVVPFEGSDQVSVLAQQVHAEPAPPSSRVPELPRAVDAAIARLMRKDPKKRPPNLASAVRDLELAATSPPAAGAVEVHAPGYSAGVKVAVGVASALVACAITLAALRHRATEPAPAPPIVTTNPAPPVQVASPPAPAIPQTIALSIDGVPPGTRVVVGGKAVGIAPGRIELPRGTEPLEVVLDHAGFASATATIVPDHDDRLVVTLQRHADVTPPKRDRDAIEDPFHGAR
jgi:tRNA A-37 threonylcarbamoyl transferase component Bud32